MYSTCSENRHCNLLPDRQADSQPWCQGYRRYAISMAHRIAFGEVRWGPVKSDLQALRLEKFTHTDTARFVESAWFLGLLLLESEAWMWRTVLALKFKSWGAEACTRRSTVCQWKRLNE